METPAAARAMTDPVTRPLARSCMNIGWDSGLPAGVVQPGLVSLTGTQTSELCLAELGQPPVGDRRRRVTDDLADPENVDEAAPAQCRQGAADLLGRLVEIQGDLLETE